MPRKIPRDTVKVFPLHIPHELHQSLKMAQLLTDADTLHEFIIAELRNSEAVKTVKSLRPRKEKVTEVARDG